MDEAGLNGAKTGNVESRNADDLLSRLSTEDWVHSYYHHGSRIL